MSTDKWKMFHYAKKTLLQRRNYIFFIKLLIISKSKDSINLLWNQGLKLNSTCVILKQFNSHHLQSLFLTVILLYIDHWSDESWSTFYQDKSHSTCVSPLYHCLTFVGSNEYSFRINLLVFPYSHLIIDLYIQQICQEKKPHFSK